MHYFVTATDTDAGKTYVTCLLLEALKRAGKRAVGFKPFCCGGRYDVMRLSRAGVDDLPFDTINPIWLKAPASPYAAALLENTSLDLDAARDAFLALAESYEYVLVEGAGGWEVPVAPHLTMADFAASLSIPVIVVVDNKLGALNHTLLTVRNIETSHLDCAGIILNHKRDERDPASISNRAVLESFVQVPILAEVMHGETEMDWPL